MPTDRERRGAARNERGKYMRKSRSLASVLAGGLLATAAVTATAAPAYAGDTSCTSGFICLWQDTASNGNKITAARTNSSFGSYNNWASSWKNVSGYGVYLYAGLSYTGSNTYLSSGGYNSNLHTSGMGDNAESSLATA
jgi:hypothetical protein